MICTDPQCPIRDTSAATCSRCGWNSPADLYPPTPAPGFGDGDLALRIEVARLRVAFAKLAAQQIKTMECVHVNAANIETIAKMMTRRDELLPGEDAVPLDARKAN